MIAIGSDHGGYDLKMKIIAHLQERGLEVKDFGCYDKSSCDYPDFGQAAARAVAELVKRGSLSALRESEFPLQPIK